jgi:O-antigen ligase
MSKTRLSSISTGLAIFFIVALPSLKGVLIQNQFLNLAPVGLVIITILSKFPLKRNKRELIPLLPYVLFFSILSLSFFINPIALPNFVEFSKYLVLFFLTLMLPIIVTNQAISVSLVLLSIWGFVISGYQFFWGIPTSEGFHYLTVGLPIAVLILICFADIYHNKSFVKSSFNVFLIIFGYLALFTLYGRSPIIFPALIIAGFLIFKLFYSSSFKQRFYYGIFLTSIFVGIYYIFMYYMPQFLVDRFLRVFDYTGSEPRMEAVYIPAVKAIAEKPVLGYGLSSSWDVVGFYPHNLFLETYIDSGILGFILIITIVILFIIGCLFFLKNYEKFSSNYLALCFLTLYHLLVWNVSYDLPSAYGLFPLMAIISYKSYGYLKNDYCYYTYSQS